MVRLLWAQKHAQMQVDDILKPSALDMLLFVLYLYQALPQLIPRATVEFMGKLQEKQASPPLACSRHMSQMIIETLQHW